MNSKNIMSGVILEGTKFEGKLTFKDKMRLDGEFKGEIKSTGQLIVGKTGIIDGEIEVGELILLGKIKGLIKKADYLQIEQGGQLHANITVKKLEIKPGAIFEGQCKMKEAQQREKQ